MIGESRQDRIAWIDEVKGIGIVLVVLGHVSKNQPLVTWIYSFHMPLFFYIAGWLMWKHRGGVILKKKYIFGKIKRLILPFCEYRIILAVYWLLVERYFRKLDMGPIWFLPTIFMAYMIVALLNPYLKREVTLIEITAISITVLILILKVHSLPYSKSNIDIFCYEWITRAICASTWMLIAICIRMEWIKHKNIQNIYKKYWTIITIIFGIASVFAALANRDVSLFNLLFGNSYFLYYFSGICGIMFIFSITKHLCFANKIMVYLGRKSIAIMAFHEPIKRAILKCLETLLKYFNINATYEIIRQTVVGSVLLTFITIILCTIIILCINRFKKILPCNKITNFLFLFAD